MDTQSDWMRVVKSLKDCSSFDSDALVHLQEDTDTLTALKLLARFCVTIGEGITQIQTALGTEDADVIWRTCHRIAGTSELVGFTAFGRRSKSLGSQLRSDQNLSAFRVDLQHFIEEGQQIKQAIETGFPEFKKYI